LQPALASLSAAPAPGASHDIPPACPACRCCRSQAGVQRPTSAHCLVCATGLSRQAATPGLVAQASPPPAPMVVCWNTDVHCRTTSDIGGRFAGSRCSMFSTDWRYTRLPRPVRTSFDSSCSLASGAVPCKPQIVQCSRCTLACKLARQGGRTIKG
jgi:hypothetical protein